MAVRVVVSFVRDDYSGLDDIQVVPLGLTQYEGALAMSALSVLLERSVWDEMSDSEWDSLSGAIAQLLSEISDVI